MNPVQAYIIMFFTGGFLYCAIEIFYRGYSHVSMLIAGGICFLLTGVIENILGDSSSLIGQMVIWPDDYSCGISGGDGSK